MRFVPHIAIALIQVAATVYEGAIGQSHFQRLARRKVSNALGLLLLKEPKRAWHGRATKPKARAPKPSPAECNRLNAQAARSI